MSQSVYNSQTIGSRFYPVQCTDNTFQRLSPQEGHVYFVTDKKKLYLGKNGSMIPMCASSGIFYGHKPIEYDNSGNKPDPKVTFVFDEIEGEDMPELDDLILNVGTEEFEDGCFYRVVNIVEDTIETTRLTLQGTGGGGGGGGGGTGGSSANFSINIVGTTAKVYSSTADDMNVSFKGYYNGLEENRIAQVKFTKRGDTDPFYIQTTELDFNVTHTINLIKYMNLFDATKTTVTIAIQDLYGNERSTNFTIQIVELALKATKPQLLYSTTDEYVYASHLSGATSGVDYKQITYTLYAENNPDVMVGEPQVQTLNTYDEGEIQKTLDLSGIPHGIYILKIVASAPIKGTTDTIFSNEIKHKIAKYNMADQQATPLLMVMTPDVTEQYTNIPLNYLLVTSESNKEYTMRISLDGKEKTSLTIQSNVAGEYVFYFENKGTYALECHIVELGNVTYTSYLNIVSYTGVLPVIDPTRDDLMVYLNPRGKSNNATDRDKWQEYNNKIEAGQLNNFHYGLVNGWMMDADGTNYLKLSSGASLTLPKFKPFEYDPTKASNVNSRMGYGMTIEIDFEVSGVLNFDADIIKCYSTDKDNISKPVGFRITGDKIRFYNSRLSGGGNDESLLSLNITEGKRIRVSFVIEPNTGTIEFPMCYIYLNGKLSGAVIYDSADNFKDSDFPATFQVFSDNAEVKLYGVRFYSSALADKVILNNYTASLPTLAERQAQYESNNVFKANGDIDYMLVAAEDYNLQIPYMKITGGWATEKDSKWQLKNQTNANVGLPTGKKDYRLIDVEVKYPDNDYFANYKDYKFVNKFASGKPMAQAYGEKPSNGGAIMYAQGTSSMEYPVKNLRLRFKKEDDWYVVRPDIAPVEIICMKADYMESSGSHNTGAANLVDALYTGVGIETPGQNHFGGEGKDTIVTCIKGHPCLIFYSETGEAGTYKYIGKYNLNLDKATPEPFGFNHDDSNFGYLAEGEEYYAIKYDDDGTEFIGQMDSTAGGDYVSGQIEQLKTVQPGEKVNSIHCFEFLDNAVEVCNFLPKTGYTYEETWYSTFKNSDNEMVPGWTLGFESRYPEDRVGYHDADMLYPLARWLNELHTLRQREIKDGKKPENITYTYKYTKAEAWEDFIAYYTEENGVYTEAYPTEQTFKDGVYYTRSIESSRFEMDSLERFKREYECYLDKDFLLTYYLVTEALLMADSRVKNMMIATWNKEKRSYKNLNNETVHTNNYIFYPIFYDMDTMLGLDNTGVYRFNYYDEDTDSSIFNGDEVLWNFVRDALVDDLAPWYSELEGALLTSDNILPYFNKNQANMANEAFYNGDAVYKYTGPAREGYYDYLNGKVIAPGAAPFLYAAQGDRSLMREWFLTNRIKFLRGKYNSSNYQSGDRIEFRWYYPTGTEQDEALRKSIAAVPPDGDFEFTSLRTGYAGVKLGANGNVYNERFNGVEDKVITLPEASSANGTEAYLLGLSNLTNLGDLSNKYMQKFIIASEDVRLKDLTLGNPHKDYHNPYWKPGDAQSQAISLKGCTYLENFNLQNCSAYNNVLDFSPCPAIKKVFLTGSSVGNVTLPINGMLEELRLPTTVTQIRIESHSGLTEDKFSIGTYDYGSANKIGEGNGYKNDYSRITSLYVVDTPINTYDIIVDEHSSLADYYLQNITWNINTANSIYCKVSADEYAANPEGNYYQYDTNNGYITFTGTYYPANGNIYRLAEMLDANNNIVCIPALEYLQTKKILKGTSHAEALSGTITINIAPINGVKVKADELFLYEKYKNIYPHIKINYGANIEVAGALTINFYHIDKDTLEAAGGNLTDITPAASTLTANQRSSLKDLMDELQFTPVKPATNTHIYEFTGEWYDWNNNKAIYYQDEYVEGKNVDSSKLFSNVKPTTNMNLVPRFNASIRTYTVNFYDYDYTFGDTPIFTVNSEFGQVLGDIITDPRAKYLYRPADDTIEDYERFTFKGWQSESDFKNNENLTNINNIQVRSNLNYFAYYEVEDATLVASDLELFNITETSTKISELLGNGSAANKRAYTISVKSDYANLIGGRITLPSKDANGNEIKIVGNFQKALNVTDVYFLSDASYEYVGSGAFYSSPVVNVYLPISIRTIGDQAFAQAKKLRIVNLNDDITLLGVSAFSSSGLVEINELPKNLITLGHDCFSNAGENVYISTIPDGVYTIPYSCFMNCPNVTVNYFPAKDKPCQIQYQAFFGCGESSAVTTIEIQSPWVVNDPFDEDFGIFGRSGTFVKGYTYVTTVTVYAGLADDMNVLEAKLFGGLRDNVTVSNSVTG